MSGIRSIRRGKTVQGYATSTSAPIYVDSDDNRVKLTPAGSGTTEVVLQEASGAAQVEDLTAARVLTAADSGKTFSLNLAGGFTVTLPALVAGLHFKFVVGIAPSPAYIISSTEGNNIAGKVFASDGEVGDVENAFSASEMNFVATKALIGDNATFDSVSLGWYSNAFVADNDGATYTN